MASGLQNLRIERKHFHSLFMQDEEAWEGILDNPKETSERESHHKKDNSLFLRFLHYLDSENLTADKHVQPGADPDYYLEELKKSRLITVFLFMISFYGNLERSLGVPFACCDFLMVSKFYHLDPTLNLPL